MRTRISLTLMLVLLGRALVLHAGEYDFAIPEAEKKSYDLGGRLETRVIHHRLNDDSARNALTYYGKDPGNAHTEWRGLVELSGSYGREVWRAFLLTHHEFVDTEEDDGWDHDIYEGFVSLTPSAHLTLDAGKKRILWGKGYAWNPAGFLNRPKDPDDPALNLEGRVFAGADLIKSLPAGPLSNIGITALVLPVLGDWANEDLGGEGDLYAALKIYLLWYDTDIDFIYFDGPDQPRSLGLDFAKNLAENFEVHGEFAFQQDAARRALDPGGLARETREDQMSFLLGLRYLNAIETTFIVEYYHNDGGLNENELEDFFAYQTAALEEWDRTGRNEILQRANLVTRPLSMGRNLGTDYLYVRVSQKEPFDILYFNPWAAAVVNLQDLSFNVQPGMTWVPVTNLEINFRVGIPIGPPGTEFGEKPDALRPEFWVRYYF